ncbi:MAG: hypothetical protein V4489_02975 [Chlamydiota bacterium]
MTIKPISHLYDKVHDASRKAARGADRVLLEQSSSFSKTGTIEGIFKEVQNLERSYILEIKESEDIRLFDPLSRCFIALGKCLLPHRYFRQVASQAQFVEARGKLNYIAAQTISCNNKTLIDFEVMRLANRVSNSREEFKYGFNDHTEKMTMAIDGQQHERALLREDWTSYNTKKTVEISVVAEKESLRNLQLARAAGVLATAGLSYLVYKRFN